MVSVCDSFTTLQFTRALSSNTETEEDAGSESVEFGMSKWEEKKYT